MSADPFPLARGDSVARHIAREFAPWVERIEIAGSIRRRVLKVGDIDLVILPRDQAAILARLKQRCRIFTGDSVTAQNTIAHMADGTQVDIFFARPKGGDLFSSTPGNFGSLFLCRTGSKAHNIALCARANRMGLHYDPYRGVIKAGVVIAWETEEEIYAALDLPFLHPESDREDGALKPR